MADSILAAAGITISDTDTTLQTIAAFLAGATTESIRATDLGTATLVNAVNPNIAPELANAGIKDAKLALIPTDTAAPIQAELQAGVLKINVELPANTPLSGFAADSLLTPDQAKVFLNEKINEAIPSDSTDPALIAARQSMVQGVEVLTNSAKAAGIENVAVNFVAVAARPGETTKLAFSSEETNDAIVAYNPLGGEVEVSGASKQVVIGDGTVHLKDAGVMLAADFGSQTIITSAGADTVLTGGGWQDTVVAAGNDLVGINGVGTVTVQNFGNGDKLAFVFPEVINSIEDVQKYFSGYEQLDNGFRAHFTYDGVNVLDVVVVGVSFDEVAANLDQYIKAGL